MTAWNQPNGHRTDDSPDGHDPDPMWDLEDLDDEPLEPAGPRRIPWWVIVLAILVALALVIQLAWPLVMDLLDRGQDSPGFPTPGPV
jgi:hypothetical protein